MAGKVETMVTVEKAGAMSDTSMSDMEMGGMK